MDQKGREWNRELGEVATEGKRVVRDCVSVRVCVWAWDGVMCVCVCVCVRGKEEGKWSGK